MSNGVYDDQKTDETAPDDLRDLAISDDEKNEAAAFVRGNPADKINDDSSTPIDNDLESEKSAIPTPPANSYYKDKAKLIANQAIGTRFGKKGAIGAGAGITLAIIISLGAIFSFLNVFKLDGMLQNIDQVASARLSGASDRRSSKWVAAYITMRLGELEGQDNTPGDKKNVFLRAEGVDTNRPFTDWYRTMRTSKSETDLLEKNGIRFVSVVDSSGKRKQIKSGVININGKKEISVPISDKDIVAIQNGDLKTFNKYQDFVETTIFNNDKDARRAIKKAVNDNTHSWQIIKRRHVRKDIQNVTGVRDWRFFPNTRDKIDNAQIDMRNKLITSIFPEDTNSGKFVRCLFGIADCKNYTSDIANPENRATATGADAPGGNEPDKTATEKTYTDGTVDNNGDPVVKVASKLGPEGLAKITASILSKVNVVMAPLNVVGFLDQLSFMDKFIAGGKAAKMVSVARGQQLATLYATVAIARDQLKSGDVTEKEVGSLMSVFGNASNSEGWTKVIANTGTVSAEGFTASTTKEQYCTPEHQAAILLPENKAAANKEYAWSCPDKTIGGSSNAQALSDGYNQSIGKVVTPIVKVYDNIPGKSLLSSINNVIGNVVGSVTQPLLDASGASGKIDEAVGYVGKKSMQFAGAGPLYQGDEPDGQYMNGMIQGAAYMNESSIRESGGAATTKESKKTAINTNSIYETDNKPSLSQQYFAVSNPKSFVSRNLFTIANNMNSGLAVNFTKLVSNFGNLLTSPFSKSTKAAASPYAASSFAQLDTNDFPEQCFSFSPITGTIEDGTNVYTVFRANGIKPTDMPLTWELVTDSDAWYKKLYEVIGNREDAGDIALQIYNCHLLDNRVACGLGCLNGWTNDKGLEDNTVAASDTSGGSAPPPATTGQWSWPVGGNIKINSCFGEPLSKGKHPGLDIAANYVPAYAPSGGVVYGTPGGVWGTLIIKHSDNLYSVFEHMDSISVKSGDTVTAGQQVGKTGNTAPPGGSSGPHLHFTVTTDPASYEYADMGKGKIINPLFYLNNDKDYQQCSATPRSA